MDPFVRKMDHEIEGYTNAVIDSKQPDIENIQWQRGVIFGLRLAKSVYQTLKAREEEEE